MRQEASAPSEELVQALPRMVEVTPFETLGARFFTNLL